MKIIKRYVTHHAHGDTLLTPCRYSEFEDLRKKLVKTFPHAAGSLTPLPPKSVVCKSSANQTSGPPFPIPPRFPLSTTTDIDFK